MNSTYNLALDGLSTPQTNYLTDLERQYKAVICTTETELCKNPKCATSINRWITSYQALSDIYYQNGQVQQAQQCLLIPHHSILHMANCSEGDDELKLISQNAMKLTLPPLLDFAKKHPPCEHCVRELEAQREMIENDDTVYH